jgi:hypothetical protein
MWWRKRKQRQEAEGAIGAQARDIATTEGVYTEIILRHASRLVGDGCGEFYLVAVDPGERATSWAKGDATITLRD